MNSNNERKAALNQLLNLEKDLTTICQILKDFSWDSDELVFMNKNHALKALTLLITKKIMPSDLEVWANMIEGREDIGFESPILMQIIEEIANPTLFGVLDEDKILKLKSRLLTA